MISEEKIHKESIKYFKKESKSTERYQSDFSDIDFIEGANWAIKEMQPLFIEFAEFIRIENAFGHNHDSEELFKLFKQSKK